MIEQILQSNQFPWIIAGVSILITIITIVWKSASLDREIDDAEQYLDELEEKIQRKELQLTGLRHQTQEFEINRTTGLPKMVEDVLDDYERQGIRIPIEIIEELNNSKTRIRDISDVYQMIDFQRNIWKQENMKKVYNK